MPAPASAALGGTPTRVSMPQAVETVCLSPPPQAIPIHPNCGCITPPQAEGVSVPQSATAFAPSRLGRQQRSEDGAHAEVGPKPKLSPRGSETKEGEWKSSSAAAQAAD